MTTSVLGFSPGLSEVRMVRIAAWAGRVCPVPESAVWDSLSRVVTTQPSADCAAFAGWPTERLLGLASASGQQTALPAG